MLKPGQYRWMLVLGGLLLGGFAWLECQLYHIQIQRHQELQAKAARSIDYERRLRPSRGMIRDLQGRVLACNQPVKSIYINPCRLGSRRHEMAELLAFWQQSDPRQMERRLQPQVLRLNDRGHPVYDTRVLLERNVSWPEWGRLRRLVNGSTFGFGPHPARRKDRRELWQLQNRAVLTEDDAVRRYPLGSLAAHVVGFVEQSRQTGRMVGREGIERSLNERLRGVAGWCDGERDVLGDEVVARRSHFVAPVHGLNVVLTLDVGVQQILEAELAGGLRKYHAVSACGVILRPRDGAILALASLPAFNPQNPGATRGTAWRNRVIHDVYEPGSTFKIVTYAAALNERFITLQTRINCENGAWEVEGAVLRDLSIYQQATVEEAITHSLSIAAAKVGGLLGPERLYQYILAFGFGQPTHVLLPGERAGVVSPLRKWTALSITRIPIGYEVAVTPLQMALAMGVVANRGRLVWPRLVDRLEDEHGQVVRRFPACVVRSVVRPETADTLAQALEGVVSNRGTASAAALPNFRVAGKTGTARRVVNKHYAPGKYSASFCGFFPVEAPELCILILFQDPTPVYFGGRTAAPVFRQVAARTAAYLGLKPGAAARQPTLVRSAGRTSRPSLLE